MKTISGVFLFDAIQLGISTLVLLLQDNNGSYLNFLSEIVAQGWMNEWILCCWMHDLVSVSCFSEL
jgi:hypothetical protein